MGMMSIGPFFYMVAWIVSAIICLLTGHIVDLILLTPALAYPVVYSWIASDLYGGDREYGPNLNVVLLQILNLAIPIGGYFLLIQMGVGRIATASLILVVGFVLVGIEVGMIYVNDWIRGK